MQEIACEVYYIRDFKSKIYRDNESFKMYKHKFINSIGYTHKVSILAHK